MQLALQTSEETRERTEELNVGFNDVTRTWELIVKYHGSLEALAALNVQIEYLIAGYAILTVPEGLVERVADLEEIEYVEKPKRFFYEATSPVTDSCILQLPGQGFSLTGRGVLLAVLDSGIDYRLPVFQKADGSTRIRCLWDQTLVPSGEQDSGESGGMAGEERMDRIGADRDATGSIRRPPEGFRQGVEFDSVQINVALRAEPQQQFMLLPTVDTSGHGTAVAGIAAVSASARHDSSVITESAAFIRAASLSLTNPRSCISIRNSPALFWSSALPIEQKRCIRYSSL